MEDRYYIKNKDNVIGAFHWDGPAGAMYPVLDQDICLPWFITNSLGNWLSARTPPKHRANMQKLLEMCGLSDTRDIINYSKLCFVVVPLLHEYQYTRVRTKSQELCLHIGTQNSH